MKISTAYTSVIFIFRQLIDYIHLTVSLFNSNIPHLELIIYGNYNHLRFWWEMPLFSDLFSGSLQDSVAQYLTRYFCHIDKKPDQPYFEHVLHNSQGGLGTPSKKGVKSKGDEDARYRRRFNLPCGSYITGKTDLTRIYAQIAAGNCLYFDLTIRVPGEAEKTVGCYFVSFTAVDEIEQENESPKKAVKKKQRAEKIETPVIAIMSTHAEVAGKASKASRLVPVGSTKTQTGRQPIVAATGAELALVRTACVGDEKERARRYGLYATIDNNNRGAKVLEEMAKAHFAEVVKPRNPSPDFVSPYLETTATETTNLVFKAAVAEYMDILETLAASNDIDAAEVEKAKTAEGACDLIMMINQAMIAYTKGVGQNKKAAAASNKMPVNPRQSQKKGRRRLKATSLEWSDSELDLSTSEDEGEDEGVVQCSPFLSPRVRSAFFSSPLSPDGSTPDPACLTPDSVNRL